MRCNLPQETKTKKLNSLPSDLLELAEELIADKFDVKEEVVEKKSRPNFPGSIPKREEYDWIGVDTVSISPGDVFVDPNAVSSFTRHRSDEVRTRIDFFSRRRIASVSIAIPTTRGIRDSICRLDQANLPRDNRKILMSSRFWNELKRDPDIAHYLSYSDRGRGYGMEYVGSMLGCKMFVSPDGTTEVEVSY